jgi:thiamine-phosphate pyrophosphorylase
LKTGAVTLARFYPIVPAYDWLARIVPVGVKLVQLRIMDAERATVVEQTRQALELTRRHGCQLILNDYWDVAIETGVDFVHLGQDDLRSANVAALKRAGIRLGISTHDEEELATALAVQPDYVALGPVYETKLKKMPWAPQGLDRVSNWREKIGSLPLVAIGGLTPERAAGVLEAGADSLAVITDFFTAPDPEARVRQWLNCVEAAR